MGAPPGSAALVAFVGAGVLATLLADAARRFGAVDDGTDAPERKPQRAPIPLIGGAVIVGGAGLAQLLIAEPTVCPWPAIACAFLLGFLDDVLPRGLSALWKLVGQIVAGIVLAASIPQASPFERAGLVLAAVIAQNALNTFDNADGAAVALAACGFAFGLPAWAGACAGFLPFNLRPWARPPRAVAFLGDAGSHALGLVLLCTAAGRAALFVPLLDLARVALVRMRAGEAPWKGDRRHLAHRLERCGVGPLATVLVLCAIAAPAIVAVVAWPASVVGRAIGAASSALLFVAAVRATRRGATTMNAETPSEACRASATPR